jgi:hypothetical protein
VKKLRNFLKHILSSARCFRAAQSISTSKLSEPDLSQAAFYNPSADLSPEPRALQREIQLLNHRFDHVEDWIKARDKTFEGFYDGGPCGKRG